MSSINTIIGYDPINLESHDIRDWIMMDEDNIVLNVFKLKEKNSMLFLIKKSYFEIPNLNDIFKKCVFYNNAFLPKESYKLKEEYINIGYLFGINCLILKKNITKSLLKKKILNLEVNANEDYFINREYLQLQYIGLIKQVIHKSDNENIVKEKKEYNKNLPYKIDVYFEKLLEDALYKYSCWWDAPINNYLRFGDAYFETPIFKKYQIRYGKTKESSIRNVKDHISRLDRVFLEYAPRNEDENAVYWRGMKTPFENLKKKNDSIIVKNFLSLSVDRNVAIDFTTLPKGGNCCLYLYTLDKGVPYIDMINSTMYKNEKEILLPRNLTCTLIDKEYTYYGNKKIKVYNLRVSLNNITNFKINNMCNKYYNSILTEIKDKNLLDYIKIKPVKQLKQKKLNSIVDDKKNKNSSQKVKQPRCPKGTRRNKKTGLCEPNIIFKAKSASEKKEKKTKCPKGTRRNKKTGLCEPK